jgi:selenocysteine lyase/cysteine desulfurase
MDLSEHLHRVSQTIGKEQEDSTLLSHFEHHSNACKAER